jgi:hypothetical protein
VKTISIDPNSEVNSLLDQARDEDLIVRSSDGSEFILSPVDDEFSREVALTRANEKVMALLEERGRQTKTVSLEEAKRRLGLSQ